ncbi:hypothetical protein ACMD2_23848 [Ananas comosus]|uniref:Uncharacterized protein n=1 Tax=Ananas comosus TaxID=4615 RepID=A0A199UGQ1_ANACO|nr:hypothetical protein ACMD2_23848 [Ananas comosus]
MADNCFAHLFLAFKFHDLTEEVDDILGRTYRKNYTSRAKVGAAVHDIGPLRRGLIAPSPASVQRAVDRGVLRCNR